MLHNPVIQYGWPADIISLLQGLCTGPETLVFLSVKPAEVPSDHPCKDIMVNAAHLGLNTMRFRYTVV